MRILHYSLGFPPYRSGGLTKFCVDLMKQQVRDGNEVGLLWPGRMGFISHGNKVVDKGKVNVDDCFIHSYEIVNPLPVPYDEGIDKPALFMKDDGEEEYRTFLLDLKPDVIHFHTLMGIHNSFIKTARENNIRLVFTVHDFFPICPKVTMFRNGIVCECVESCDECGACNNTALSLSKIRILQSPLYRLCKDSLIIRKLRKNHRDNYLSDRPEKYERTAKCAPEDYKMLRNYYYQLLNNMDIIHYNSSVTKEAIERFFQFKNTCVFPISHGNIGDYRFRKDYTSTIIRIRYLGAQSAAKGYYLLKEALDELWKERQDFIFDVHFIPRDIPSYMRCHERYSYEQLRNVFNETDVLICPSIWQETFGYTVLEALSYGVPVIISNTVGAKDIIEKNCGIIYRNKEDLLNCLRKLSVKQLSDMNVAICNSQKIITMELMTKQILSLYQAKEEVNDHGAN